MFVSGKSISTPILENSNVRLRAFARPSRPKGPDPLYSVPPLPPLQQALELGFESSEGLQGPGVDIHTLALPQRQIELLQSAHQLRAGLQKLRHL